MAGGGPYRPGDRKPYVLGDVLRFFVRWAMQLASRRGWGELRIVMQDGHIMFITETGSWRDGLLPNIQEDEAPAVEERLLRAVGDGG